MRHDFVVLHLEDNPDDRLLLATALDEAGVKARLMTAENAVQLYNLMRLMRTALPDLVVVDLNLPVINGRTVLREISLDPYWSRVPAVVLSSSTLEQDISTALALGAEAYFVKPQLYEGYLDLAMGLAQRMGARKAIQRQSQAGAGPAAAGSVDQKRVVALLRSQRSRMRSLLALRRHAVDLDREQQIRCSLEFSRLLDDGLEDLARLRDPAREELCAAASDMRMA